MDIVNAYAALGTYRGAAGLCGTTHKTVKRVLERRARGQANRRQSPPLNTACVQSLIEERVRKTDGRISAKRLLPVVRAAGYGGSLRNLQRAVMSAKAAWKHQRRVYRPWVPTPGEHLVVDWGSEGGYEIFCAVLAWSRYRFVRVATDQTRVTTLQVLAECFAELDGVPSVVLTDRMGCLRAGTVAILRQAQDGGTAPGVRAVRAAIRLSAGLLRGGGPRVEGRGRSAGRLRPA
jgi:hypothetical protein